VVSAGKSRFTLQTLPAADFPRVETGAGLGEAIRLPQKTLKRLLQLVQFAHGQPGHPLLPQRHAAGAGRQTTACRCTDGHRLSYAETELEADAGTREVIIPRKTVVELSKLLGDVDDAVELRIGANQVTITLPGTELVTKWWMASFPITSVSFRSINHAISSQSPDRDSGIAACGILSNEKFRGVRLVMSENTLGIDVQQQ